MVVKSERSYPLYNKSEEISTEEWSKSQLHSTAEHQGEESCCCYELNPCPTIKVPQHQASTVFIDLAAHHPETEQALWNPKRPTSEESRAPCHLTIQKRPDRRDDKDQNQLK